MKLPCTSQNRETAAFTLLEVMVAVAILFMCLFSILGLVSQSLRQANSLQRVQVDIGSLASELVLTNQFQEGVESGDFGNVAPGFSWTRETVLFTSNNLFQVNIAVYDNKVRPPVVSTLSTLFYKPGSVTTPGQAARPGGGR